MPTSIDPALTARWLQALDRHPGGSVPLARALPLPAVLQGLLPLRSVVAQQLGAEPWCIAGQCWVRRAQPAHHWHQDGALHHDFIAVPQPPPAALLPMVTCWIALTPCGGDAPGLEWVEPPLQRLLSPAELADAAVRACFAPQAFVQPVLAAGEVLVFGGGLLHRTQHCAATAALRTSIELRFCARPAPLRLAGERLLPFA